VGIHVYCRQRNGKVERGGIKLNEKILESLEKWCIHEEEELDLREKNLGKEGIKYLSKHKWANLVSLNLCNFYLIQLEMDLKPILRNTSNEDTGRTSPTSILEAM
jgi:hypothetical protein